MDDIEDTGDLHQELQPPPQPALGNEEFPIPCARFVATLRHTENEVWGHHLRIVHGRENHTPADWRALLEGHRNTPAHPSHR